MPEAAVFIGLNSPPVEAPGLRSQRSMWLGPPPIQSRMQLLPCLRSCWALASSEPKNCIAGTARVAGLGGIAVSPAPPRFATTLVLRADGTYRLPSTHITSCGPEIPDEVGTYRTGRRRRLILSPTNVDEIDAAGTICIGYPLRVTSYRTVVTLARSGRRLHGTSTLGASLEIFGQAIPFHAVAVFKGTRGP